MRKLLTAYLLVFVLLLFTVPALAQAEQPEEVQEPLPVSTELPSGYGTPSPEPEPLPLTPDGTGMVIDNVYESDGKEFFTVTTPDGNNYYLIIDRQRNGENVYLLKQVTDSDLASFVVQPEPEEEVSPEPEPEPEPLPEPIPEVLPEPQPEPKKNGGGGMLTVVLIVVFGFGGAAYYFKIVRGRKQKAVITEPEETEYDSEYYGEHQNEPSGPYSFDEDNYESGFTPAPETQGIPLESVMGGGAGNASQVGTQNETGTASAQHTRSMISNTNPSVNSGNVSVFTADDEEELEFVPDDETDE